jgi:hypothetical protein
VLLHMAHIDMGSIECAGGLQIQAVSPALVIRNRYGAPLSRHGKQRTTIGEQKANTAIRIGPLAAVQGHSFDPARGGTRVSAQVPLMTRSLADGLTRISFSAAGAAWLLRGLPVVFWVQRDAVVAATAWHRALGRGEGVFAASIVV